MPTRLIDLDAAGDRHVVLARHHLRGGEVDRVEARGAEAVDLHARHGLARSRRRAPPMRAMSPPCSPTGSTQPRITSSTESGRGCCGRGSPSALSPRGAGSNLVQRAVLLAAPARRADGVVDEGVGHARSPCRAMAAHWRSGCRGPGAGDFEQSAIFFRASHCAVRVLAAAPGRPSRAMRSSWTRRRSCAAGADRDRAGRGCRCVTLKCGRAPRPR